MKCKYSQLWIYLSDSWGMWKLSAKSKISHLYNWNLKINKMKLKLKLSPISRVDRIWGRTLLYCFSSLKCSLQKYIKETKSINFQKFQSVVLAFNSRDASRVLEYHKKSQLTTFFHFCLRSGLQKYVKNGHHGCRMK